MARKSGASLRTVNRALDALLLFDKHHPEWSVAEMAQAMGLHRSIVYRILSTLEQRGMVSRSHGRGRYRLGLKLVELANVVLANTELPQIARQVMERLMRETDEAAFLTVISGDETVCIAKVDSLQPVRSMLSIGDRSPLHAGAANRLLLAYVPADVRGELLAAGLKSVTSHTITDPRQLEKDLAQIREQGWAYTVGELTPGAAAIAAPLRNSNGAVVAALSIAGLAARFSDDRLPTLIRATCRAAEEISAQLLTWHEAPATVGREGNAAGRHSTVTRASDPA